MRIIGNIIWFVFGGLEVALSCFVLGLLWCATIVGIPFGIQIFKISGLVLWPFGKKVDSHFARHAILNLVWIILGGFGIAIGEFLIGLVYCITILGFPFGLQHFKLAKLTLMPFGAETR